MSPRALCELLNQFLEITHDVRNASCEQTLEDVSEPKKNAVLIFYMVN